MKLFVVLLCLFSFSVFSADGKLIVLKGKVSVNKSKVGQKSELNYGDTIRVGKKGLAIVKLKSGSTIKVKALSKLVISKPKMKNKKKIHSYILKYGDIFLDVKKKKNSKYKVIAKNVAMGVRGTQFFVSSTRKKKKVWMCVNEGKVGVSFVGKSKKAVVVNAGEGIVVDSNELPEVKEYQWTKDLNWKFAGKLEEVDDKTNIRELNYDLENFEYD